MTILDTKEEGLPHCFAHNAFLGVHKWYSMRQSMNLPHTRDLLSGQDDNIQGHKFKEDIDANSKESKLETEHPK